VRGSTRCSAAADAVPGDGGAMRRFASPNPVTLFLWVLDAGMEALIAAEYVSERM